MSSQPQINRYRAPYTLTAPQSSCRHGVPLSRSVVLAGMLHQNTCFGPMFGPDSGSMFCPKQKSFLLLRTYTLTGEHVVIT